MKRKHRSATQILRHIIQLAAFLLLPGLFVTVFSAVGEICSVILHGNFSAAGLSAQLIIVITVFLITALWGRFFCSFLCSFGMMQELAAYLSQKTILGRFKVPAQLDRVLKCLKYFILAFFVVGSWILALPVDASFRPWGVFGMLVSGNISAVSAAVPTVGFCLLLAILVGSLFIERFFCRYLCPLGALFALAAGRGFFKIRRSGASCTECGLCTRECAMGVNILEKDAVASGECIGCMQCLTVCPRGSLSANPSGAVAGTAAAVAISGMALVGDLTAPAVTASVSPEYFSGGKQEGKYEDGVYTGTGKGFRGDTEVQVTVEGGYITDITVLSYQDDSEFFHKAQAAVASAILSGQSLEVDAASGATYSSNSIIEAVADALGTAPGQPEGDGTASGQEGIQEEGDGTASGQEGVQEEGDGAASEQEGGQAGPDMEGQEEGADHLEREEGDGTGLGVFSVSDGTYEGSGMGFCGTTTVSVVVKNGVVTDITVKSYEDDSAYFSRAEDEVIREIIRSQSLEVDAASGATYSSKSIIEAVSDALGVSIEASDEPALDEPALDEPAADGKGSGQGAPRRRRLRKGRGR